MDRNRGERPADRFGDAIVAGGGGGPGPRMPSRWPSGSPPQPHRYDRGGGGGGREAFSGGGNRYHPYRAPQDFAPPSMGRGGGGGAVGGGGFRGGGGNGGGMGSGGFGPPLSVGGPTRGFPGRGSPDHIDGSRFAKLFIGSVPRTASEEDIRPLFEEHGNVIEVAFIKDRKTGEQQGCCFVKYRTAEEANRAIRALHNQFTLPGGSGPIQVRFADGDREHHGSIEDKLFVASLNKQATPKEIEDVFSPYGHVEDVYIMRDAERQSRGCGFVKFANRDMAAAALNGLNGKYVMRGCDQPLVVRFADPKRPRPGEQRGGPAFGGPGFSPRSEGGALVIRPTGNLDEHRNGRNPPDAWQPLSPEPLGPPSQFNNHSGGHASAKGGPIPSSENSGHFGPSGGPSNGSHSGASMPPSSQQGFNMMMAPGRPTSGQHVSPLQKTVMPPQTYPPSQKLHQQQSINYQAPMQQLGQTQAPQSGNMTTFNQGLTSQQLPGIGAQTSTSQSLIPQNASSAAQQAPLNLQQQGVPAIANPQQFTGSTQQLLQQPSQQLPSQLPQALLQQQAQALQSSFQSSQQAIIQLQQQLQMMHQQQQQQQQVSLVPKQEAAWSGPVPSGSVAPGIASNTPANVVPSMTIAGNTTAAASLTCNWTEHSSPEGFKYYYNSVTRESKWEKPEEYAVFEQQQQQQKLLLLQHQQQQQQQKLPMQQLSTPSDLLSHTQVHPSQQVPQMHQAQSQIMRQQQSLVYQGSVGTPQQNLQDFNYSQLAATSTIDPSRLQQGIQGTQEWAWKNKPAGS